MNHGIFSISAFLIGVASLLAAPALATPTDGGASIRTVPALRTAAIQAIQLRLCVNYRERLDRRKCLEAGARLRSILAFSGPLAPDEVERLARAFDVPRQEAAEIAITAIHTDRLSELLRDSTSLSYLGEIQFRHRYTFDSFRLWEESLRFSDNPAVALERIAVLFQDLSQAREHLTWAIAKGAPESSLKTLEAALTPLMGDLQVGFIGTAVSPETLARYYPKFVSDAVLSDLTPGIYHFYSAAYWAYRLRAAGVLERDATLHAFGIHLAYELSDIPGQYWPMGYLPEKIPGLHSARDLASAYWGARYGVSLFDGKAFTAKPGLSQAIQGNLRSWMRHFSEY